MQTGTIEAEEPLDLLRMLAHLQAPELPRCFSMLSALPLLSEWRRLVTAEGGDNGCAEAGPAMPDTLKFTRTDSLSPSVAVCQLLFCVILYWAFHSQKD